MQKFIKIVLLKIGHQTGKSYLIMLAAFFSFAVWCCIANKNERASDLRIGIAEVNYTPEIGLDLAGNYRGNDYASRGIHDPLYARAIVAEDKNGNKAVLLTLDICFLLKESVDFMRGFIASKTNIRQENILISATHTHSGPKADFTNPRVRAFLLKASEAVILANEKLKPTIISAGRTSEERISFNRRLKCIDGTTHMCWEKLEPGFVIGPLGPIDPEVLTISLEQEGKAVGALINFGCHATTLTGNNWLYSADYPGYLGEAIKKVKGNDFIPLFFNGCCGNVTQVDYRIGFPDTYQECQRIGYILGVSAMEAIKNQVVVPGNLVTVSKEMVPLKRIAISEEQLNWAKQVMNGVEKNGMPPIQADGIPDAVYGRDWIRLSKIQSQIDSLEVMVVRIGGVAFVGLPGEMFAEFGMKIKAESPFKNTFVMGLTNDKRGYFPTKISFTQGPAGCTPMITGYETTPGTTLYEIGSGEILTESAIRQLNKLF